MTSIISSSSTNTNSKKYDPMYCLQEHLEYFAASVAKDLQYDFDEIFGGIGEVASLQSPSFPDRMVEILRPVSYSSSVASPFMIPSNFEACFAPVTPAMSPKSSSCPNPTLSAPVSQGFQREMAVVSPTSVASSTVIIENAPASNSRKRQISDTESELPSLRKVDPSEKEDVRRERNRQHAKRSRQRKRQFLDCLEESVQEMKSENERLFHILGLFAPEDRRAVAQREDELAMVANECFIAALQKPQNRVLGDDALASLRELFE